MYRLIYRILTYRAIAAKLICLMEVIIGRFLYAMDIAGI